MAEPLTAGVIVVPDLLAVDGEFVNGFAVLLTVWKNSGENNHQLTLPMAIRTIRLTTSMIMLGEGENHHDIHETSSTHHFFCARLRTLVVAMAAVYCSPFPLSPPRHRSGARRVAHDGDHRRLGRDEGVATPTGAVACQATLVRGGLVVTRCHLGSGCHAQCAARRTSTRGGAVGGLAQPRARISPLPGQSLTGSPGGGAWLARLCPAAPSIEVVSAGRQPDPLGVLGRVACAAHSEWANSLAASPVNHPAGHPLYLGIQRDEWESVHGAGVPRLVRCARGLRLPPVHGPGPDPRLRVDRRRGQSRGAPRGACDRACTSFACLQAGDDACRRSGGSCLKRRLVPFGKRQPIALGREHRSVNWNDPLNGISDRRKKVWIQHYWPKVLPGNVYRSRIYARTF